MVIRAGDGAPGDLDVAAFTLLRAASSQINGRLTGATKANNDAEAEREPARQRHQEIAVVLLLIDVINGLEFPGDELPNREALKLMQRVLRADITPSGQLNLNRMLR